MSPDLKRSNWDRRPLAVELAARLRACWHIIRGRRVIYRVNISGGRWNDEGWQRDLVFVDCQFLPGFRYNEIPAIELRDRFGDVRVRSEPIAGFERLP